VRGNLKSVGRAGSPSGPLDDAHTNGSSTVGEGAPLAFLDAAGHAMPV